MPDNTPPLFPPPKNASDYTFSAPAVPIPPPPPAAGRPNSLETSETSVSPPPSPHVELSLSHEPPEPSMEQMFRHSGWQPTRKKIRASLFRTFQTKTRIEAFDACGSNTWVYEDTENPGTYKVTTDHCHDRLCIPCGNARVARLRDCLFSIMGEKPHSFITLTLSGKGEPLCDLIDRLYRHFRALRLHPRWAEKVRGGGAFLEIKWNVKAARWHPHLHIIADADYLDQGILSELWRGISRDSFIVDIRRIKNPQEQGRYITKYASKPLNPTLLGNLDKLDESVLALKGRRLCLTFGTWYGTPLTDAEELTLDEKLENQIRYKPLGKIADLFKKATAGDVFAQHALTTINFYPRIAAFTVLEDSG